jgi:GNAT superfamily N-acetyltransferase
MIGSEIRVLNEPNIVPFAKFTFPAYRYYCDSGRPNLVAIGLFTGDEPAGLVLGVISSKNVAHATVLSVLVSEPNRGKGYGRQLLDAFEREVIRCDCHSISGQVTGSEDRSLAVERLLAQSGWQFSGPSSVLCRATLTILEAPWLGEAKLPKEMEVFPWLELQPEERAAMLEQQAQSPWIPDNLSPFWNEPLIAGCSLGMRYQGRVSGWCVAYSFEADTLRWWRLFVVKELQPTARAVPLLAETIRRAPNYGYHFGVWSVRSDNRAMMRLLNRRMRPWLISAKPVWTVHQTSDRVPGNLGAVLRVSLGT